MYHTGDGGNLAPSYIAQLLAISFGYNTLGNLSGARFPLPTVTVSEVRLHVAMALAAGAFISGVKHHWEKPQ